MDSKKKSSRDSAKVLIVFGCSECPCEWVSVSVIDCDSVSGSEQPSHGDLSGGPDAALRAPGKDRQGFIRHRVPRCRKEEPGSLSLSLSYYIFDRMQLQSK